MKKQEQWKPTKFLLKNGTLKSTFDPQIVGHGSRLTAQLVADMYQRYIPQYCTGKLVDLGCGRLPLYGFYKQYVTDTTAVDWGSSINFNEHLDILADLNSPPIPELLESTFDCAILSDVLEHIYEPRLLLKETARILKSGGYLLLNVPFYYYIHEMPHDYHRYTEFALSRYLEENGFEILYLNRVGGSGACWVGLTSKIVARMGCIGRFLTTISQRFFCATRKITPVKQILFAGSDRTPLGYFIVARKK